MTYRSAQIRTKTRLWVPRLSIAPALIGLSVSFKTGGAFVQVTLPPREKVSALEKGWCLASCGAWQTVPIGPPAPISFEIHALVVELEPSDAIDYPLGVDNETLPTAERFRLHRIGQEYIARSERALEVFFQVARWQSKLFRIGRPKPESIGVGIKMFDRADGSRLYGDGGTVSGEPMQILQVEPWLETVRALRDGVRAPIYWDLLLEAEWQLDLGDLRRTVADMAMACELFIQAKVTRSLPRRLRSSIKDFVERTNAGTMRDKLFADTLAPAQLAQWPDLRKKIQGIADRRNSLLHRGSLLGVTTAQLEADIVAARTLLGFD